MLAEDIRGINNYLRHVKLLSVYYSVVFVYIQEQGDLQLQMLGHRLVQQQAVWSALHQRQEVRQLQMLFL